MGVFDAIGERIVLVEAYPYDPDAAAETTVRFADRDFTTLPIDTPASVHFDGYLIGATYSRSLVAPGVLRGSTQGIVGAFRIGNPSNDGDGVTGRKLDAWHRYRWQGRRFRVWLLEPDRAFSAKTLVLTGSLGDISVDGSDFVLAIRDRVADLQQSVQSRLYSGAGGFNGGTELAGRPMPIGVGLSRKVPAPFSDAANLWIDLNPGRSIKQVLEVEDQGVALPADASNPPASGKHYVDYGSGRVRLGGARAGEIRVSFRGDDGDSGHPYVWRHADVFRFIAREYGGIDDPDGFDTASFAQLNTDSPAEMGIWIPPEPRSVASILDEIMGSAGGWWFVKPDETIKVGQLKAPTAAYQAQCDLTITDYDIVEGSLQRLPMDTPPWQIVGRYRKYYGPIDRTGLAGGVTDAAKADYGQEWRQRTKDTTATLAEWPYSVPLTIDLLIDDATAAQTETDRVAGLHSVGRRMFQAEVGLQVLAIDLHDQVWLDHPDEGLADGAALRLIAMDVDLIGGTVVAQFWG